MPLKALEFEQAHSTERVAVRLGAAVRSEYLPIKSLNGSSALASTLMTKRFAPTLHTTTRSQFLCSPLEVVKPYHVLGLRFLEYNFRSKDPSNNRISFGGHANPFPHQD